MAKRTKRPASTSNNVTAPPPAAAPVTVTPAADAGLRGEKRIAWQNVSTVLSAAILIGAEVFGGAFAGGWAVANLFELGQTGVYVLQAVLFAIGMAVMVAFVRNAQTVEPFFKRG